MRVEIIIAVFLLFLINSCSIEKKKEINLFDTLKSYPIHKELNMQYDINIISNKGLVFTFEIIDTIYTKSLKYLEIECKLENLTNNEINYLESNCDDIQMFLKIIPDAYDVEPTQICSHSWTSISRLKAHDFVIFTTNLRINKGNSPIENIGLDLRVVDSFISKDSLLKDRYYLNELSKKTISKDNIIWSK